MHFRRPDRVPLQPGGPRESTLAAWHQQGLPEGVHWYPYLLELLGIETEPTRPTVDLGVSLIMIPTFEERVLEHRDGHFIVQDWMGAITEISDTYDYTYIRSARDFVTRKWHSFPVKTRQDWEEKIRWRYDPTAPGRFPDDFEARCAVLRERDTVLTIAFSGAFWQLREWCGMEGLCLLMADEPEFVEEMEAFWTNSCCGHIGADPARTRPAGPRHRQRGHSLQAAQHDLTGDGAALPDAGLAAMDRGDQGSQPRHSCGDGLRRLQRGVAGSLIEAGVRRGLAHGGSCGQ